MHKPTIGLEIHIELKTKTKMFCACLNDSDEIKPNVNICPVCMGHPGTLPVINEEAVKKVIKTGLALNSSIPEYSKFDRKNYFYPDLPKGYQISQYDKPLCVGGYLELIDGKKRKKVRITRIHLEEDTGKLIHGESFGGTMSKNDQNKIKNLTDSVIEKHSIEKYSLVDFNRAGIPLMELVTEPDIVSAKEAKEFAQELHLTMHYLDISDADMEKGQMRVEVNISVSKDNKLGTKVEIKNLNSFRSVERSIDYEIKRQTELLQKGEKIIQETRGWDDIKGVTFSQRQKEEAHDYRYFPEPDLPPLHFIDKEIKEIKSEIPELPWQKRERIKKEYNLDQEKIEVLVYNKNLGGLLESVILEFDEHFPKEKSLELIELAANYLITDWQALLKESDDKDVLFSPKNFAELIILISRGEVSSKIAKMVISEMFKTGNDPSNIIREKGLSQISNEDEIENIVKEVIAENQKVSKDYQDGKESVLQFLIGQAMAKSKGKANPQAVSKIFKNILTK